MHDSTSFTGCGYSPSTGRLSAEESSFTKRNSRKVIIRIAVVGKIVELDKSQRLAVSSRTIEDQLVVIHRSNVHR